MSARNWHRPLWAGLLLLLGTAGAHATTYPLPPENSRLIGQPTHYTVPNDGKPLEAIASRFQIGLLAMMEANPGVDPFLPTAGSRLIIPTQMLLPDTPRDGIVINLSEMRLYYYPEDEEVVHVLPIGIGRLGRETPLMTTYIISKQADPIWNPTANTRKEYMQNGIVLPKVVPAGPDNPMGKYALRMAHKGGEYLIHGTNKDFGIGLRVSAGCIRLRPDDIEFLFEQVPVGTSVRIIDEPIKISTEPNGKRYLEVHQPLSRTEADLQGVVPLPLEGKVLEFVRAKGVIQRRVTEQLRLRSGLPVVIGY